MLGATHMFTGAAIYKKAPNVIAGYTLAFLSHFLLDAIPHHDLNTTINYSLGILAGISLLFIALYIKDIRILVAAFLGAFPDINWILKLSALLNRMHSFFHSRIQPSPLALVSEGIIITTAIFILLKSRVQ